MTSNHCTSCGAAFPVGASACSYCGSVIAENIRVAGGDEASSAEKALTLLEGNIENLRGFPLPENGFITMLRIYLALITMGISLVFWRRPKRRFRIDEFRKLRGIIETNMELLKARHAGNEGIIARISALEGGFVKIESFFRRQIVIRRSIFIATAMLVAWIAITGEPRKRNGVDESAAYVPAGEIHVAHGMKAHGRHMALITRTSGAAQRVYVIDRDTGETRRVLDTDGRMLEECCITRVRAAGDRRFEYTKHEGGRWSYHFITWDDAKKHYVTTTSR